MAVLRAGDQTNLTLKEHWPELVLDFLLQAALLTGLAALSVWLWPNGMLDRPVGLIKLVDWLWAAGAIWVAMLCVFTFYFVVAEPVIALMAKKDPDSAGR